MQNIKYILVLHKSHGKNTFMLLPKNIYMYIALFIIVIAGELFIQTHTNFKIKQYDYNESTTIVKPVLSIYQNAKLFAKAYAETINSIDGHTSLTKPIIRFESNKTIAAKQGWYADNTLHFIDNISFAGNDFSIISDELSVDINSKILTFTKNVTLKANQYQIKTHELQLDSQAKQIYFPSDLELLYA